MQFLCLKRANKTYFYIFSNLFSDCRCKLEIILIESGRSIPFGGGSSCGGFIVKRFPIRFEAVMIVESAFGVVDITDSIIVWNYIKENTIKTLFYRRVSKLSFCSKSFILYRAEVLPRNQSPDKNIK